MKQTVLINGEPMEFGAEIESADIVEAGPGVYSVLWRGRSYDVRVAGQRVMIGGRVIEAEVIDPRELRDSGGGAAAHGRAEIVSPMPGKVIRILVEEGTEVEAGQGLLVVEAMKMQNELTAHSGGVVSEILVEEKAAVSAGQPLVRLKPEGAAS